MSRPIAPAVVKPIPVRASRLPPRVDSVNGISSLLNSVDEKLKLAQPKAERAFTTTVGDDSDSDEKESAENVNTRPLEELIDIFENGPRPASVALQMLNDEEVILLAQNGKIAPYALEKVLGDLERAVRVRRALICRSNLFQSSGGTLMIVYSPRF